MIEKMYKLLSVLLFCIFEFGSTLPAYNRWDEVYFKAGDFLECHTTGNWAHVLLASSSSAVIHIVVDKSKSEGKLVEEPWERYHRREGEEQTQCRVHTKNYDLSNSGNVMSNPVGRARADVKRLGGKNVYYHGLTCNEEHWVSWWRYGLAFSYQSLAYPSTHCKESTGMNVDQTASSKVRYPIGSSGEKRSQGPDGSFDCSRKWIFTPYCWRYCSGESGEWCYTSNGCENCGSKFECGGISCRGSDPGCVLSCQ